MNEPAAMKIIDYMTNYLSDPVTGQWSKKQFSDRSTEKWCASEILELILDNPGTDPQDLIEFFIFRLIRCQYLARKRKAKDTFLLAEDVANDILINLFTHN